MPPARGAGRGRGRGRGRGGAAAADGPAVDGVVKQEVKEEPDASSTDTLMATPPVELAPEAAPVAPMLVDSTSSSMSPASAPTETPAPTPVRPPVQRLETLGLSARGQLGAPRGPSGVGRGTGRAMAGKFKPKAVRRGIEERAQAEAEEKARREEREKEAWQAENAARGNLRGRWMRGRGRGDAMGRGGPSDRGRSAATGLFSVAPSGEKSGTRPAGLSLGGGGGGVSRTITGSRSTNTIRIGTPTTGSGTSTPSFKTEGGMNIKEEIPEPVYPEEVDGGDAPPRIDIETINLVSDDEEEDGITDRSRANKGKGRSYGMNKGSKPVRLYRAEHKERITIVNTESAAASLGDKNKQTAESVAHEASATNGASGEKDDIDQGFTRDGKPWKGAWRDEEVKIKPEPEATTTNNIDDISDEIPVPIKESDSPKATRKQPLKQAPPTPKKPKVKEKPVLQTEEDRAEYARQQEDIRILTEELGNLQRPTGENADGEPAAAAAENGAQNVKDKEGRLYLFQFPPVLPPLIDQAKKDAADQDVEMGDVTGVENGDPAAAAQENQNEVDVLIKNEDGTLVAPPVNTTAPLIPEPGHIGRLIVRKSGKVELDWGGTILKLGRGVEATFLTTTVLVDSSDEVQVKTEGGGGGAFGGKEKKEEVLHGSAVGMGRVMGKFVAVPDFDSMLDLE